MALELEPAELEPVVLVALVESAGLLAEPVALELAALVESAVLLAEPVVLVV